MLRSLEPPIAYLITSGETTAASTPASKEFSGILQLIESAVSAEINLIQIREKALKARVLYELTERAVAITRRSNTRLLINDRADVAQAARADGVHLTSLSLPPDVIRRAFGDKILIGASTHSIEEATQARELGADFVVFGPVYETASKQAFGPPMGPERLKVAADALAPFPVLAIGGINEDNLRMTFTAGVQGIAAIGMFSDPERLSQIVARVRTAYADAMVIRSHDQA